MRRVTALIVVLAAMSAAFPLVASADHGRTARRLADRPCDLAEAS